MTIASLKPLSNSVSKRNENTWKEGVKRYEKIGQFFVRTRGEEVQVLFQQAWRSEKEFLNPNVDDLKWQTYKYLTQTKREDFITRHYSQRFQEDMEDAVNFAWTQTNEFVAAHMKAIQAHKEATKKS